MNPVDDTKVVLAETELPVSDASSVRLVHNADSHW